MKDHQVTGASVPLIIGGEEFQASPLTDRDHSELDLWIQGRIIRMARASCEGCTPEERKETMDLAMEKAATVSWLTNVSYFNSLEGAARLAWQMVKHNHDISHADIINLFANDANINAIADTFKALHPSFSGDGEDKSKNSNGSVGKVKSRRRKQKSTGH